jgi:hypothetical protein
MSRTGAVVLFILFGVCLSLSQNITVEFSQQIWNQYLQQYPNYCIITRTHFLCGEQDFQRNGTFYMNNTAVEVQVLRRSPIDPNCDRFRDRYSIYYVWPEDVQRPLNMNQYYEVCLFQVLNRDPSRIRIEFFENQILRVCTYTQQLPDGTTIQWGVQLENLFFTDNVYDCDPRLGVEPRPNDYNAQIIIGITIGGFALITIIFILIIAVIRCAVGFENPYALLVNKT